MRSVYGSGVTSDFSSDVWRCDQRGLEFHTGVLYWRPQIRYVRWMDSTLELNATQDSVQALLGISFGK